MTTAGVLLAGGRGSRMGGPLPKPLVRLAGLSLAEHVLARLRPHLAPIYVSANDPDAFAGLGLPIIPDVVEGFAGPLAGLHAVALDISANALAVDRLLAVPGDTPFLPADLVVRMLADPPDIPRVARCGGALQPTVALWPLPALLRLGTRLAEPSVPRSIRAALEASGFETIDFPADPAAPDDDPFFNINTPGDLARAESRLQKRA